MAECRQNFPFVYVANWRNVQTATWRRCRQSDTSFFLSHRPNASAAWQLISNICVTQAALELCTSRRSTRLRQCPTPPPTLFFPLYLLLAHLAAFCRRLHRIPRTVDHEFCICSNCVCCVCVRVLVCTQVFLELFGQACDSSKERRQLTGWRADSNNSYAWKWI